MTKFWPSTHPSSRNPCRNASSSGGLSEEDVKLRKPIRGTFPVCCCACKPIGHAIAPPTSAMNSRRLTRAPHPRWREQDIRWPRTGRTGICCIAIASSEAGQQKKGFCQAHRVRNTSSSCPNWPMADFRLPCARSWRFGPLSPWVAPVIPRRHLL